MTYAYYSTSGLKNTTSFTGGTTIARGYDTQGRIQTITNTPATDAAQSYTYTYTYNNLNQRTRVTREDGSYWSYIYNDRGELISGKKYWSDNAIVWGAQTENNFDNIGNRSSAKNGGNQTGSLRQSNYTANSLNQYGQRTVPGAIDVTGSANAAATVSVNDQAMARKADYFYKELAVDNSAAPVYSQINIVGARSNFAPGGEDAVTQKGGRVFVPQAAEVLTYDDDGNLTSDGRWNYTWDGENRLSSMEAIPTVPVEAKLRLEFAYDDMARRIQKKVYVWNVGSGSYQLQTTTKFGYDGWNLVAELDGNNNLLHSYIRDRGELLLINGGGNSYQVGHDGNRNVGVVVSASTGTVAAVYDYDAFGRTVKTTGPYADQNPVGFSEQYTDSATALIYYGYRYYNPQAGRWVNRDPIEEQGGKNLYAMVNNDLIDFFDPNGLQPASGKKGCPCCCAESVDVILNGFFQGGPSLNDYYPDLVGNAYLSDQPNKAGTFINTTRLAEKCKWFQRSPARKQSAASVSTFGSSPKLLPARTQEEVVRIMTTSGIRDEMQLSRLFANT